ncbi:winged helix-turn-helix domain-containing protein [Amycolatopsis thermoflava]|uniref:winged helix-turn-helix domain-containing protein n=1 Tax=Amycolatopsis thermoflava TaxID=84480 RepID=UPI00381BBE9E
MAVDFSYLPWRAYLGEKRSIAASPSPRYARAREGRAQRRKRLGTRAPESAMTEDRRTPQYVYRMVFEQFKARIESGELPPNTPLPAERRLAAELGVALGTLRHATQLLRDEGLVVTVPSKGTFVCEGRVGPSSLSEDADCSAGVR